MLIVELAVALVLALGAGDALPATSPAANPVSLGEELVDYQRPKKEHTAHYVGRPKGNVRRQKALTSKVATRKRGQCPLPQ